MRPGASVCQPDRRALRLGESEQRVSQTRFDVWNRDRLLSKQPNAFPRPAPGLSDAEQISDGTGHLSNINPVFIGVCKRLADRIVDPVNTDRAKKRPPKTWFRLTHKHFEVVIRYHAQHILTP